MYFECSTKPLVTNAMKERARYILLIVLCLLLRPGVTEAVKVELDEGSSSCSTSMSVGALVDSYEPDLNVWLSYDINQFGGVFAQQQWEGDESIYATASASIDSSAHTVSPYPGVRFIDRKEIYNVQIYHDCVASPGGYWDPVAQTSVFIPASFSCNLIAAGSVVWDLLPTDDEETGEPVIVSFGPVSYGISYSSFNTTYEQQICTWEFGISEGETDGPYEVTLEGVTPEPAWENIEMHAHIGDKIMLSYEMYNVGGTQDPSTGSSFASPWGGATCNETVSCGIGNAGKHCTECCWYDPS